MWIWTKIQIWIWIRNKIEMKVNSWKLKIIDKHIIYKILILIHIVTYRKGRQNKIRRNQLQLHKNRAIIIIIIIIIIVKDTQ